MTERDYKTRTPIGRRRRYENVDWTMRNPELARLMNTTAHAIGTARHRYGAPRLASGPSASISSESAAYTRAQWIAGRSFIEIAREFGVTTQTVRRSIRRHFGADAIRQSMRERTRVLGLARLIRRHERKTVNDLRLKAAVSIAGNL